MPDTHDQRVPFARDSAGRIDLEAVVDFAATPAGAADLVQLFNIPKGVFLEHVTLEVLVAEGGTLTLDLGDYTNADPMVAEDADGYLDGVDGNAAAGTQYSNAPGVLTEGTPNTFNPAYAHGRLYTADNIVALLVNNAADAGKVRVRARGHIV